MWDPASPFYIKPRLDAELFSWGFKFWRAAKDVYKRQAFTTIVGGTTSGYSLIGSLNIASNPMTKIAMDNTPAKIGRLMKKCEKFILIMVQTS